MFKNLEQKDFFWLMPIVVLVIAILPMPIGYYTLSRIIVFAGSIYFSYKFYSNKNVSKTWIFAILAILYNPILPIYLYSKFIWVMINILTIVLFWTNKKNV